MSKTANKEILLVNRPTGMPTEEDFALVENPIPTPGENEILVTSSRH